MKDNEQLEAINKFKEKSTITEEDAIRLGRELNRRLSARRLSDKANKNSKAAIEEDVE